MEWITTSTVLERLRVHDEAAWNTFAERFRRPLLAFARRFGLSESEAEDAAQNTLLAFTQSYREGKYDSSKGRLSSWLFGIAYRQIANLRRKEAREQLKHDAREGHDSFWAGLPAEREASVIWDAEWERAALEAALRQARREVSENTYRAFEIVVREGRSPEQAANELGISRDAVYVAKHRVLKRMGELVQQHDELEPA